MNKSDKIYDLFVIGGGINGCGIARDATGRGLSVALAEMNDLASATSSASTKLFHGGLRYLEYFEFRLVREALIERETLLRAMPHISWPMRFVLPLSPDMRFDNTTPTSRILNAILPWMKGRRPSWLIRLGLLMYDNMGGRKILPATRSLRLRDTPEGTPLKGKFERAYEYSDCWVDDARLVVLNARDAELRGAKIMTRTRVVSARRGAQSWEIETQDTQTGAVSRFFARAVVNAAGPWVGDVIQGAIQTNTVEKVRLVRGSHIVTKRLFDHDRAYFFQGTDGRIIFAIPYEQDFTLIGTTDQDHKDPSTLPKCTDEEQTYLLNFANQYLEQPLSTDDIVWTYSGVRPLYDDGATSASAATRDYVLKVDAKDNLAVLNVFGGKITTYRRLAESALSELKPYLQNMGQAWTAGVTLPGGGFESHKVSQLTTKLRDTYPFLDGFWATRLIRSYGTEAWDVLGEAKTTADLGEDFGATLTQSELDWQTEHEFARTAEDVIWRRSKLGLRLSPLQKERISQVLSQGQA